jgi:hypothetical protein
MNLAAPSFWRKNIPFFEWKKIKHYFPVWSMKWEEIWRFENQQAWANPNVKLFFKIDIIFNKA